jgi:hypothetical protein
VLAEQIERIKTDREYSDEESRTSRKLLPRLEQIEFEAPAGISGQQLALYNARFLCVRRRSAAEDRKN